MDYRTSGILDGPLKAGIVSVFLFIYTLYFVKNKYLKVILSIILFAFSVLQARTSVLLFVVVYLIYIIFVFTKSKGLKISSVMFSISSTVIILALGTFILGFLGEYFPNFQNTVNWQLNELLNLGDSRTVDILLKGGVNQIQRFFSSQPVLYNIFGNGLSNWNGFNSIHSDNGFVTLFIGLGSIGLLLLVTVFVVVFVKLLKHTIKYNSKYQSAVISLFIILIAMNIKSTSLLGYHYFNLIMFTCFLIYYAATVSDKKVLLEKTDDNKSFY